ncbi:MAG: MBL fold metallo-hydrolase [Hyphomicrobiales bacterium]|nr:MAG: MBL fold metallo-hydrolase [Hyphomicrobiales bacterium]
MSGKRKAGQDELVFLPLGGAGEIGMNLYLYGLGPASARQWIIVDLGISFPGPELPGIEVVMPDTAFLEQMDGELLAIVLTHAHEDHYGAIPYLWPRLKVPVYATAFSAGLLRMKLHETGLEDEVPVHLLHQGERFKIGPFDLELITVTHSIPEPNALAIRTRQGNVLHSGDWRIDPDPVVGDKFDEARMRAFGAEGCRAVICDSTNILSSRQAPSEAEIGKNLAKLVAEAEGRVAITTFASNVGRILSVMRATKAAGRHLVLAGRSMHKFVALARETGLIPQQGELLSEDDYGFLPREKVVLLCTGSQGEARAALSRIASGSHPRITLNKGDTVIFSSKTIPGNEKEIGAVENNLAALGIKTIHGSADFPVHVTGHPYCNEVERLYDMLKPEAAIPIHGETLHLATHAERAREWGVKETVMARNGDLVRIAPGKLEICGAAPAGRLCLDGKITVPAENGPLRIRRRLNFAGAVVVFLAIDKRGALADDPLFEVMGLPERDDYGDAMEDVIFEAIDEALDVVPRKRRQNTDTLAETVRRSVRRAVREAWGKKTECRVQIARV